MATNLEFSKIVSTPTPTSWSQAYSAGRLFAALALQIETIPQEGPQHLNSVGKDLISAFESEFFTLENKDLDSIKQAILTSISRIGEGVIPSLVVCFLSENVLYLFALGGGKAVLKRGDKIGTVLEGEDGANIKSASGYVQDGDVIILQTKPFVRIIPSSTLASSLDNASPEEITEDLAPQVHEKAEGGAAAVVLTYKEGVPEGEAISPITQGEEENDAIPAEDIDEEAETIQEEVKPVEQVQTPPEDETETPEIPSVSSSPFLTDQIPKKRGLSFNFSFLGRLPRNRRTTLIIAGVLVALILIVTILALQNRKSSSSQKLFDSVYNEAQTKYDEGVNLKDLNAPLAKNSFNEAKNLLEENQSKFTNSSQKQKIEDLLAKINKEITSAGGGETASTVQVKSGESKLLSYEINNSSATYFTQNDDNVYFLDGSGVSVVDKGNDKKTNPIKKTWKTDGGIGLFGSNIYVLDKTNGVLKFVPSEDTYSKANYFGDSPPDLGEATAMAIDGSIYILFSDGHIEKYTKAKKDTFEISGMDKSLSNATKIFTDENADNLYILDKGNSRVVVLDKEGKFKTAYSANIIKNAKDFEVSEEDKKIFILSSEKVYQIDLK